MIKPTIMTAGSVLPQVCVSYLAQVAQQPGVGMWLAEAGQPVREPGVSRQQPRRPNRNQGSQSCSEHNQDPTEARPAEDGPEERHPGTESDPEAVTLFTCER